MPIDPTALTFEQYAGHACVVDGIPLPFDFPRVPVGLLGPDLHHVYACPDCARTLSYLVMERVNA